MQLIKKNMYPKIDHILDKMNVGVYVADDFSDVLCIPINMNGDNTADLDLIIQHLDKIRQDFQSIKDAYNIDLFTEEYAKVIGKCIFHNIMKAISFKIQNNGNQVLVDIFDSSYRADHEYIFYAENHMTGAGEALFGFRTIQELIDLLLHHSLLVSHKTYYQLGEYIVDMLSGTDIRLKIMRYAGDIRSGSNGTYYEHFGFVEKGVDVSHCVEWVVSKHGIAIMDFDTMRCDKVTGYASQFFRTTKPVYFPIGVYNLENGLLEVIANVKEGDKND